METYIVRKKRALEAIVRSNKQSNTVDSADRKNRDPGEVVNAEVLMHAIIWDWDNESETIGRLVKVLNESQAYDHRRI